jgi:hypothetical protein
MGREAGGKDKRIGIGGAGRRVVKEGKEGAGAVAVVITGWVEGKPVLRERRRLCCRQY